MLDIIINKIKELDKEHLVIAIDGKAASGKTTLANLLKEKLDAEIISTDDFFLPLSLRTDERFNEIGGNIHYERFIDEVVSHLHASSEFNYRIFDCSIMDFNGLKHISNQKIIIVEGSYSLHPKFGEYADITIFLDIDQDEQKERLMKRSPHLYNRFIHEWIPLENKYFNTFNIKDKVDLIF